MAWKDICSKTYDSNYNTGKVKVVIQYDDSSITTTSLTCRAKGYLTSYNGSCEDTYFIYSSDGGISRICYLGGTSTKTDGSVYYTGNTFKLTKTNTATYFKLPELRLCNDGSNYAPSNYTDSNGRGYAIYWNNERHMWTTVNSGGSTISTSVYVREIGTGTTTIKNNGNNTFTITAKKGSDKDTYNEATGLTNLKWGYTQDRDEDTYESGDVIPLDIDGTKDTRRVYAESTTVAKYGNNKTSYDYEDITQYFVPNKPGKPVIKVTKGGGTKVTLKEDWEYSWTSGGTPNSTTSPVKGYYIRLYKNGSLVKGLYWDRTDTVNIYRNSSGTNDTLDRYTTSTKVKFDPNDMGFKVGDKVKLSVSAYTQWGDGSWPESAYVTSDEKPVVNAGIVHVKVGGAWKEGQVYVKVGGAWKEASSVHTKVNNAWKESQ